MAKVLIWSAAILVAAVALDRLLLWMESRGWIRYRRSSIRGGGSFYHLLNIHSIYNPEIRHVIDVQVEEQEDEDESGDPPGPDGRPESRD